MSNTIYELSQRLVKSLDSNYNVIDMDAVLEIITTLEITKITREQLEITRLGKFINQLRRKTGNESLARRSKNLLKKWREMVMPDLVPNSNIGPGSGTKIKITNGRLHQTSLNNNQRLPKHNNNNGGGAGDCDTSNTTTTTTLLIDFDDNSNSCNKIAKKPTINTQLVSFENLITQAKLNSGVDLSNDGVISTTGKGNNKIPKIPRTQTAKKSTARNNDNSLLSNDDTNCSNNSAYFTQEPGIPLLNGLKSIFNTDGSQTSVEKFVASNKVRNKGRGKLTSKLQTVGPSLMPSPSDLFIYHDSLSNSESVSHFNSNSNKQNTTSIPNTNTILNQESDLTFKNKITPPNYLFQNNSKTSTDTVIIDSSSDDDNHDIRNILIKKTIPMTTKSPPVLSTENSRSNVITPPNVVTIQKPEALHNMISTLPIPPIPTPPAPKRRGRKKGSKGCDYELATLGGFNNMGAHNTGSMAGNTGPTSSIMSDIRNKLTSFSGGTTKKIKTTKELLAEIQNKKLGSSVTSSPVLSTTTLVQMMRSSPTGFSEDRPIQLSPPLESTSATTTTTTAIKTNSTITLDCNSVDNNLSPSQRSPSSAKITNNSNNNSNDDLLLLNTSNNNSNDNIALDSSKKLFKTIDDEILYLGEQLPKLEKCAINWSDDDDLIPCTCQLKLIIDSNISSSSTCSNNNNNNDNINNNNNDLLHTSNDLTVILTNNSSSKVSNDDVVNDHSGGNLLLNHQSASISITIDKNPEFLNNNNNNNISTKKPIKSIFDVDYDDEIDNNGDNNSSSKHEYYINNLNNSDNISNSNYNISVPIGKTKLLSTDVPPPPPPSSSLHPTTNPPSINLQNPSLNNNNNNNNNSVDPSLLNHNENSIHDNLLQDGQNSVLVHPEQWTVDEDPNCKAKQFYVTNKSLVKDYHIKGLHNYFINNLNGNWDNYHKSDIPNLNDCEYLKNSNDITSYINSPVVPKYNHIDNHKIRKNLLHIKFNNNNNHNQKSKKLIKKRIKKLKKSNDENNPVNSSSSSKSNPIIPIIIKSDLKFTTDDNNVDDDDHCMTVETTTFNNNKNIKKRLHSSSSASSSLVSSKNSLSSEADDGGRDTSSSPGSSSSDEDDVADDENNDLLPSFNNITDDNLTGVNTDGCVFKEWHEIVHAKSYNDEPLTILPYVVID